MPFQKSRREPLGITWDTSLKELYALGKCYLSVNTSSGFVLVIPEFGSVKNSLEFPALLEMSAYHHVKDGTKYPAVLLTTGWNDPVVDPWQPAKMAARLQVATTSGKPVLLRVDNTGHDSWGSTRSELRALRADQLAFMIWQAGAPAESRK